MSAINVYIFVITSILMFSLQSLLMQSTQAPLGVDNSLQPGELGKIRTKFLTCNWKSYSTSSRDDSTPSTPTPFGTFGLRGVNAVYTFRLRLRDLKVGAPHCRINSQVQEWPSRIWLSCDLRWHRRRNTRGTLRQDLHG